MQNIMIVPNCQNLDFSLTMARRNNLGFEFDDFFWPDSQQAYDSIVAKYQSVPLPAQCTLHGAFLDVIVFSRDPDIRAISRRRVLQSMELAVRLKVKAVILHTSFDPLLKLRIYEDNFFAQSIAFYKEILTQFPNIDLYLENVGEQTPDPLLHFCTSLGGFPNFGICLDIGHANLTKLPPLAWVKVLSPHIRHFHLNDNFGDMDTHLALGTGSIDYPSLLPEIRRLCPNASILIELADEDAIRKSLSYLLPLVR